MKPAILSNIQPVINQQEIVVAAAHSQHLLAAAPEDHSVAEKTPATDVSGNGSAANVEVIDAISTHSECLPAASPDNALVDEDIPANEGVSGKGSTGHVEDGECQSHAGNTSVHVNMSKSGDASKAGGAPTTGCNGACSECCNKVIKKITYYLHENFWCL